MVQPPEPCLGATPGTMSRRNPRNMCVRLTSSAEDCTLVHSCFTEKFTLRINI